jgi:hypothetical protein
MAEETVEQLKKMRIIEHMEFGISDLQKFGSNPLIINSLAQLHDSLVIEYNEMYAAPKPVESEDPKAHPTVTAGKKEGEKKDTVSAKG